MLDVAEGSAMCHTRCQSSVAHETTKGILRNHDSIPHTRTVHVYYGIPVQLLSTLCALVGPRACNRGLPDYGIPVNLLSTLCALVGPRVCDRGLPGASGSLAPSPSTASVRAIAMPWREGNDAQRC